MRAVALAMATIVSTIGAVPEDGPVIGTVSLTYDEAHETFHTSGWACGPGASAPVAVSIVADRPADGTPPGTRVSEGNADLPSEAAVGTVCRDPHGRHRFDITIPAGALRGGAARTLYVYGTASAGGSAVALDGSAIVARPARWTRALGPFAPVAGHYVHSNVHPRVFMSPPELVDLARRIDVPGGYSARRFAELATQIAHDLASTKAWDVSYTGCTASVYQYAFSYEPQDGRAERIGAALRRGTDAPAGAAVVASRLALYAALVRAGATAPVGAPRAEPPSALAKTILLAWSVHGFRHSDGSYRTEPNDFCDDGGAPVTGVQLIAGRGIIYSVEAQDLLQYAGALSATEATEASNFHAAMFELIRRSANDEFARSIAPCDRYNNQAANGLAGLLALARLRDDPKEFEAALDGTVASIAVRLPWNRFFNGAIYGRDDASNACRRNTGHDGSSSVPFFETEVVAPGEVDDRFRNLDPQQGIGYPAFTLERMFDGAEVMRGAGFDGYGYRGARGQSIRAATDYYACYAANAGFGAAVTRVNSRRCPDVEQYVGKIVNGVDPLVVLGALRYPDDPTLSALEAGAEAASATGPFALDAIRFGRWND